MEVFVKKTLLLFLFFSIPVLCCIAKEWPGNDGDNEALSIFSCPSLSLPLFGRVSVFGSSTGVSALGTNSPATDLGLTRYADYERESFFKVTSPALPLILAVGGFVVGVLVSPFVTTSSKSNEILGYSLMVGGIAVCGIGVCWLVLTW